MNGKQLKNSILQWAIQGKLVPQDPNDEPASVLLERIRVEKAKFVKKKKIKKDKNESIIYRGDDNSYYEKFLATGEVKCIDEEIPFEIPATWEWVRLSNVSVIQEGPGIRSFQYMPSGIQLLTVTNILEGKVDMKKQTKFISEQEYNDKYTHFTLKQGDIVCACSGGSWGKSALFNVKGTPVILNTSTLRLRYFSDLGCNLYLYHITKSSFFKNQLAEQLSGMQPNFGYTHYSKVLLPLPPLREQKRISKLIEQILPYIFKYNSAQEILNNLNNDISIKLKKSILQEAIQGKLVPQIAEEGTAQELLEQIKFEKQKLVKESKLKKSALADSIIYKGDDNKYFEKIGNTEMDITDEIPFEIPDSWSWVRLYDICSYIQRGKSPKYSLIKKYPVVAQKCNQWSGFSIDKAQFIDPDTLSSYGEERILQDGDLMWNSTGLGTLGRMAIYWSSLNPYELAVADSHVTVIRAMKKFVMPQYLYYYFTSNTVQSVIEDKSDGSTKQKELATATVKTYLVPIPPLMEQDRIISKIKQLASIMRG